MKIAICDDEQIYIDAIKSRVCPIMEKEGIEDLLIYEYQSGKDLLIAQEQEKFDAVFLDINMPDMDGRTVAKNLRATSYELLLAFFSSHDEFVFDSFEVSPIGYIRKALMDSDVEKTCRRMIEKYKDYCVNITVGEGNTLFEFYPSKVWYFEAGGRNLTLYFGNNKTIEIKYPIKKMTVLLQNKGFIRINKYYLANCRYIARIEKEEVMLIDMNTKLRMAKNRIKKIREIYFEWLRGKG